LAVAVLEGHVVLVLTLAGLAFQLAGVAVAGWGVRLVFYEAATVGERLLDPVTRFVGQVWRRATDPLLRLLGRPRSQTIQIGSIDSAEIVSSVRASKSCVPLSADLSLAEAVAELDHRTRALTEEIGLIGNNALDKIYEQRKRHDDLGRAFDAYVTDQHKALRRRDLRAVRIEAVGLALVTVGSILQASATFFASAAS